MIVDCHAHIFSSNGPFAPGARYRPDYDAGIEQWLSLWRQTGVTHGVLVQPSFLGTDNSLMLAALKQRPETLRAVVVVDPSTDEAQLGAYHAAGVRGVRLNLIGIEDLSRFAAQPWSTLFGRMAELGWHLEVQCEGERMPALFAALSEMPLAVVIDHFGLPGPQATAGGDGANAILREAERRPVYVKLSAPYRLRGADPYEYASLYLAELGPDKLLWGSDWPWTNHEQGRSYVALLQALRNWARSPESVNAILQETPKRLYGFAGENCL